MGVVALAILSFSASAFLHVESYKPLYKCRKWGVNSFKIFRLQVIICVCDGGVTGVWVCDEGGELPTIGVVVVEAIDVIRFVDVELSEGALDVGPCGDGEVVVIKVRETEWLVGTSGDDEVPLEVAGFVGFLDDEAILEVGCSPRQVLVGPDWTTNV